MSPPLRYAFIGVGGIAHTHAKHLQKLALPELSFVGAADVKAENVQRFKEAFPVEEAFADYHDLLRETRPQAVSLCTPNHLHMEPAIAALEAGAHVLVEKPMARNTAECRRMIDAAKASGRQLVVGFQHRFSDKAKFLRAQVQAGALGDIVYTRVQALRRRGIPSWGVFGRKDLQGGGGMIDIGVHMLEMAHAVIGRPTPVTASAAAYTYLGNRKSESLCSWGPWDHTTYTVEDLAVGFIRFADGSTLTIETSFAAHVEKETWNVEVMGTKGGAVYDPPVVHTDQNGYMVDLKPHYIGNNDLFTEKMRHFIAVAKDGAPNLSPGEDGLAVQQMVDAVYASAESRREVAIG